MYAVLLFKSSIQCVFLCCITAPALFCGTGYNNYSWYDNYGLPVLQQLRDLMCSKRFIGLLVLGISALITAITSVSVAAIALTQQAHTAQYVNTMSKNVSLALATQEVIDRKLEMKVRCSRGSGDAYRNRTASPKSKTSTFLPRRLPVDWCNTLKG